MKWGWKIPKGRMKTKEDMDNFHKMIFCLNDLKFDKDRRMGDEKPVEKNKARRLVKKSILSDATPPLR